MKRRLIPLFVLLVTALALAVAPQPSRARAGQLVSINNGAFVPDTLTVQVGDFVDWINFDTTDHTATSDAGTWDTGTISGVQTVNGVYVISGSQDVYFNSVGSFPYHDTSNPSAHGVIVVVNAVNDTTPVTDTPLPTATSAPTATATPTPPPTPTATATSTPTATALPPRLELSVKGSLRLAKTATLRVTVHQSDQASGTSNVLVQVDGRKTGIPHVLRRQTDIYGVAVFKGLRPAHTGFVTVTATKFPFDPVTVRVRVRS